VFAPEPLEGGKIDGEMLSDWAVWSVVEQAAKQIGIEQFGTHDIAVNDNLGL
jgi:hypothetical protein